MKKVLVLFFLAFYAISAYSQAADKIVGIWWNDEKTTKIKVEKQNGKYIGTIVYMIPEKYENGLPPKDDENPDPALRERSVVGLQILDGLVFDAKKNEWKDGTIYDPKSGKTYDCYVWLESDELMKLKGFLLGMRFIGRSSEWYKTTLD
ncbi:MAG: DUF2147 domain-containing protein [Prolixibacteraceae bacterium]|nr:DUF2147 domain-containing protein [Prolixibacteraceae bacterium]MBN2774890.1 DUF2147 domain-containing protein [Prolixibacteraceae bacterium]